VEKLFKALEEEEGSPYGKCPYVDICPYVGDDAAKCDGLDDYTMCIHYPPNIYMNPRVENIKIKKIDYKLMQNIKHKGVYLKKKRCKI